MKPLCGKKPNKFSDYMVSPISNFRFLSLSLSLCHPHPLTEGEGRFYNCEPSGRRPHHHRLRTAIPRPPPGRGEGLAWRKSLLPTTRQRSRIGASRPCCFASRSACSPSSSSRGNALSNSFQGAGGSHRRRTHTKAPSQPTQGAACPRGKKTEKTKGQRERCVRDSLRRLCGKLLPRSSPFV